MSLNVIKGSTGKPKRMLAYGTGGIGKSWFVADAGALILNIEDGLDEIPHAQSLEVIRDWDTLMNQISQVYTDEHDFKAIAIDSIDWVERLIWDAICKKKGVQSIEDIGYARGYEFAINYWRELMEALEALRNDRGMMIMILSHCKIEKIEPPDCEAYERYTPKLHKKAWPLIHEWCDEVYFCAPKVYTRKSESKKNIAVGGDEIQIRSRPNPGYISKTRMNIPSEIPFLWEEYSQYLKPRAIKGENK